MSKWTDEQLAAINVRGTGVIVSAAAGSGKTSVLVERLIGILSDTENRIPADRMIVVTFTNDAAAQMKKRLSEALSEKIAKEPQNVWLCEQQSLLQTAKISTIHSFCFDLIRENIQSLNISAGFRVLDDTEEMLLKRKAAENTFERLYSECPEKTEKLAGFFSGSRIGDEELEEVILTLHEFLMSIPFYEDWLKAAEERYSRGFCPNGDILAEAALERAERAYGKALGQAEYANGLYMKTFGAYSAALTDDTERIKVIMGNLRSEEKSWDERVLPPEQTTSKLSFPRDMGEEEKAVSERIKDIRRKYRKETDKTSGSFFTFEQTEDDYRVHSEIIKSLAEIMSVFVSEFEKLKADKNALVFSDAEQLSVKLLAEKTESGEIVKTALARELSEYYEVVMIDEFQDANNTQDLIFKMLSRNGTAEKGGTNLFAVGDIKQSIYTFRLANPKLFADAMNVSEKYTGSGFRGSSAAILLNRNFRSSGSVIDFVNFLFGSVMSKQVGETDYTDEEALVQGLEYPDGDRDTEIIIVPASEEKGDGENVVKEEAKAAAEKIKSMLGVRKVSEKDSERPCEPRDFCILLRGNRYADIYVRELSDAGIKAYAEEPKGYLDSREISVLRSILEVIDNPMRDIPLTAALMSPMFMLTAEDMARLAEEKTSGGEKYFTVIKRVLDGGSGIKEETELYGRLERFMRIFSKLRCCAASQSIERLIRTIYDSTDFLSAVQVYKDGSRKRANLRLLLNVAESYEKNSAGGLSGFVRYTDMIVQRGGDFDRASVVSSSDNVVSVKTIHKSKGLEYPFVFLCGTSGKFNDTDLKKSMQLDFDFGIGLKIQDRENFRQYESFPQNVIKETVRDSMKSEEMRLLYVALTRAREQLFITVPDNDKTRQTIASVRSSVITEGGVTPAAVSEANSMLEWIAAAMMTHKDGGRFRGDDTVPLSVSRANVRVYPAYETGGESEEENSEGSGKENIRPNAEKTARLLAGFEFDGMSALADKSAKVTVTEIAKGSENELFLRRPEFAGAGGLTAAEKGTAMHTFMQYADFAAAEKNPAAEADRLCGAGLLTDAERASLELSPIKRFFDSELYCRMKKSPCVRREHKFLIRKSDAALDDERLMEYNDNSMLQGIADCMFEENDGIVLIDYKTDRGVSEKVLAERYDLQLRLYAAALGRIFGKPVREAYLYSFFLGREVRVI